MVPRMVPGVVPGSASRVRSLDDILGASPPADWRSIDPARTIYLTLPKGRVVIELAPSFAPAHVANIVKLARARFYDGLFVVRVQDDYVVQWGDANSSRPTGEGTLRLPPEFDRRYSARESFTALPDPDTYAPATGFVDGFPAARDRASGRTRLVHCYGMVGAGRDVAVDSGGGPELYAVIGQAPRQFDRNVTLVGRVIEGMDLLSSLPRGHAELGFYRTPAERVPLVSVRVAADLPVSEQVRFEALRTDSPTFAAVVGNRRFRREPWFSQTVGRIDVCNVPLAVRRIAAP